jgi:hypothetical protein
MPSPGIIVALSTPTAGTRSSWASVSESDGGTRLFFPSTDPGREVFQPNAVVGFRHGRASLAARRLRRPCPAERWSSRAPPPCSSRPSLPFSRQCGAHIAFMAYLSSLTGMRRLAVAPSEWLGGAFASPSRGEATPLACGAEAVANHFWVFSAVFLTLTDMLRTVERLLVGQPVQRRRLCGPRQAMGRGGGLVVPQSGSAVAEAQAVPVVPGLAGVAVGLPVPHRGAGGLKALGLGRRVQPRTQR